LRGSVTLRQAGWGFSTETRRHGGAQRNNRPEDNQVLLDTDVAKVYGVETKEVNQAVRNNTKAGAVGYGGGGFVETRGRVSQYNNDT